MKRFGWKVLTAAVAVPLTVQVASAQLPDVPYGPVSTGLGINVAADYGQPTGTGASGNGWALTGGIGLANLGIRASFGGLSPGGGASSITTYGGAAGMKLFGGGLTPVTIGVQVGASHYSSGGVGVTSVQPGAWVKVSPPLFPLKPWGHVYYQTGSCGALCTYPKETRFAVGADFNLLLGLGVHAAYDVHTKSGSLDAWGVGVHMNFRVPSLGVPGVPGI